MSKLRIVEYRDDLAADFYAINAAWIRAMFVLEAHDEHVLSHPRETIVDQGGTVLFVADPDGTILGTGALMPTGAGALELTKMGVHEAARGTGAGAFLLAALIERGRALGADPLYLLTSARCEAAIHLYEDAGFEHDAAIIAKYGATYERCDVAMRMLQVGSGAAS